MESNLNKENINQYGKLSIGSNQENNKHKNLITINEKLMNERQLALNILKPSQNSSLNYATPKKISSKQNLTCFYSNEQTPQTEPAKFLNQKSSFNITDMESEKTIDVKLTSDLFEPCEITGRSTMRSEHGTYNVTKSNTLSPRIAEILATSCVAEIRNLLSVPDSLPNTADISRTSSQISKSFWDMSNIINNDLASSTQLDSMSVQSFQFQPGEAMQSKLAADEIEWRNERAVIPTDNTMNKNSYSEFSSCRDPSVSMTTYFNQRSEDLRKMIPNLSPTKKHRPVPLVDVPPEDSSQDERNDTIDQIVYYLAKFDMNLPPETIVQKIMQKQKFHGKFNNAKTYDEADYDYNSIPNTKLNNTNKVNTFLQSTMLSNANSDDVMNSSQHRPDSKLSSIPRPSSSASVSDHGFVSSDGNHTDNLDSQKTPKSSCNQASTRNVNTVSPQGKNQPQEFKTTTTGNKRARSEVDLTLDQDYDEQYKSSNQTNGDENNGNNRSPGALKPAFSSPHIRETQKSPVTSLAVKNIHYHHNAAYSNYSLPAFGVNFEQIRSKSQSPTSYNNLRSNNNINSLSERDDITPLKASKVQMSWGSVKLRQSVENAVRIKNTSQRKLVIRVQISGPGFQLKIAEQTELITLQRHERRTISCIFCPTVVGLAVGKLSFQLVSNEAKTTNVFKIPLNGYGGHGNINVDGVQLGPNGSKFLPLGDFQQLGYSITKCFTLINRGTLPVFVFIGVQKKIHDIYFGESSLQVKPDKVIINPQSSKEIKIIFNPRRDEIKKLLKKDLNVLPIANLSILYGDEPTRHRIKRIIKEAKENDRKKVHTSLNDICTKFTREYFMDDISVLQESWDVVNDLVGTFRSHEVELTLNRDLDETLMNCSVDLDDETFLFRTIVSEDQSPNINQKDKSIIDNHQQSNDITKDIEMRPTHLEISTNQQNYIEVKLKNKNLFQSKRFHFSSNTNNYFRFDPDNGTLQAEEEILIRVFIRRNDVERLWSQNKPIYIHVNVDGDMINVPVWIKE